MKLFTDNLSQEAALINNNELTEVDNSYETFSTNYYNLYNKYFPYIRMSRKSFKDKPHITNGIKVSIRKINELFKKYLNNRNEINEYNWKRYRNKTNEIIKKAEKDYYAGIITSQNNSSKNLWKTFGKILNKNKIKHKRINSLNINDTTLTDPQALSESFNDFFSEIGECLANKFSNQNNSDFKRYLGDPVSHSMLLQKITEIELNNTIKNLKNNNSTGPDEYSTKFIKLSSPILVPALVKIFNLAISTGVYPNSLKIAKVIPIFKKGDSTTVNNYRPISILSTINKIFEKILYSRLINYIEKSNLLYKYQYGFRKNHSTEHALIEVIDQIRLNLDSNQMTCGIFIDLSKAFDTVNHQILMDKLEHYGIRGKAHELFKSYLSNRKQFVTIEKCKSQTRSISCGVPQGSVLGPLFFLIFINDLPNCCPSGNVRIFADDTNVFFHSKNIDELITMGRNILTELNTWLGANKLTLNTEKSSFIIFKSAKKKILQLPEHIEFLNYKIKRTTHIKFLGLTLEQNLTWNHQINEICNKLKRLFHIFYNIRDYLSKENIKTIYYTLIYSRIKYGITLYSQAPKRQIKKIQILQNQLLKVLSGKKYRFSTNELHNEFNLLKVTDIAKQETVSFVHNYFSNSLPPVFDNYYETFATCHNINTRSGSKIIKPPKIKTDMGAFSIKVKGAKLWNEIHNDLKTIPKIKKFRLKLK